MKRFLNTSIIDFSKPVVSVKETGRKLGLEFPLSVKKMLSYHDNSKTRVYGVCILHYGGMSRGTTIDAVWLDRAFFDIRGIARYFRKMSGGRQFVDWEIYIPTETQTVMPIGLKDGLAAQVEREKDVWIEIGFTRDAARAIVPVDNFLSWIWIIDDRKSTRGVTAGSPHPRDMFVGALDLDPNVLCHEMGHTLGLPHASTEADVYGDDRCVMGAGRTFENTEIIPEKWSLLPGPENLSLHSRSGPGICAPYLYRLGWLDIPNYILIQFLGTTMGIEQIIGPLEGSIFANQGAPPAGSDRVIAIMISMPSNTPFSGPPTLEYWIEYRIPDGFDRGFLTVGTYNGFILLRKINPLSRFGGRSFLINSDVAFVGQSVQLPELNYKFTVTEVDVTSQKISYVIEKS